MDKTDKHDGDLASPAAERGAPGRDDRDPDYLLGIMDALPEGLVAIDTDGVIQLFNLAAEQMFAMERESVIGASVDLLLAPGHRNQHQQFITDLLQGGDRKGYEADRPLMLRGQRRNNAIFPLELIARPCSWNGKQLVVGLLRDVSRRHEAEEAVMLSQERFSLAVEATNDGLWDWNIQDDSVYYGAKWQELLGLAPADIGGSMQSFLDLLHPEDHDAVFLGLDSVRRGKMRTLECEARMEHAGGDHRWFLIRGVAVEDRRGDVARIVGAISDITGYKSAEEQAAQVTQYDMLTGLPNRQSLLNNMEELLHSHRHDKQGEGNFALIVIDVDRFRYVNESLGDAVGDETLRKVANRIRNRVRRSDMVARLSGDQFAVLARGLRTGGSSLVRAEKFRACINETIHHPAGATVNLDTNIGIRYCDGGDQSAEDILRDAILALREAKKGAGARIVEFYEDLQTDMMKAVQFETDLREAIRNGGVETHFQPVVNSDHGRPTGFEALARLRHPERGLIPPVEFIPIAEETGLIGELTREVLRQATAQLAEWRERFPAFSHLTMAVNLSPVQFEGGEIVSDLRQAIDMAGLQGDDLKVEITENLLMQNSERSSRTLDEISGLGIQICIDDFGTGYSSLSYLRTYSFDTLKIDRSFISRITSEARDAELVRTIVQLGQNVGMKIVVEGVETEEQMALLRELGCHFLQGFLVSRPLTGHEASDWLSIWQDAGEVAANDA